jgi:Fur family transcriptional regulator, peroxide stress response regulator
MLHERQLENIITSLRNEGFRITPQRIEIIKHITNTHSHPSAENIHKVIQKKYPMVSLATVYKTLNLLVKMGIIQELGFAEGGARYEVNDRKHINVVCLYCGNIEDIDEQQSLSLLESKASEKSKYRISGRRFELYGYCDNCKNKRRFNKRVIQKHRRREKLLKF